MFAITGFIAIYGLIWNANPKMVAWYSWIQSVPIDGDVNADVRGYVDTHAEVSRYVDTSHQ
jgi:hypothetical protein